MSDIQQARAYVHARMTNREFNTLYARQILHYAIRKGGDTSPYINSARERLTRLNRPIYLGPAAARAICGPLGGGGVNR